MNRLKELRVKHGLTLDDIEKRTGINRGTYNNYENGNTQPKFKTWQKLADFWGVSTAYLLNLEDDTNAELAVKELEKRNASLMQDNVSLLKEIAFLVSKYPTAGKNLAHFNAEQGIKNGFAVSNWE